MEYNDTVSAAIDFKPISSRLMSLRLSAKPFKVTIMEAYAPTNESSDLYIDNFYDTLAVNIQKVPKQDILIPVGDWNAKKRIRRL